MSFNPLRSSVNIPNQQTPALSRAPSAPRASSGLLRAFQRTGRLQSRGGSIADLSDKGKPILRAPIALACWSASADCGSSPRRHGRACPGHPRARDKDEFGHRARATANRQDFSSILFACGVRRRSTWMAGTSPAMTCWVHPRVSPTAEFLENQQLAKLRLTTRRPVRLSPLLLLSRIRPPGGPPRLKRA
jgi:hypothetical protein